MPFIYRYSEDKSGTSRDNLVENEVHALTVQNIRAVVPTYGPYFVDSLKVWDDTTGTPLFKDQHYKIAEYSQEASIYTRKSMAELILITDTSVSSSVRITYQTLGGMFANNISSIISLYEAFANDTRTVRFADISDKWDTFPPSPHFHSIVDVTGFQPIIYALERLNAGIKMGNTPAMVRMVEWVSGEIAKLNDTIGFASGGTSTQLLNHMAARNPHGTDAHDTGGYYSHEVDDKLLQLDTSLRNLINSTSAIAALTAHINDQNAHNVTLETLGAYSSAQIDTMIASLTSLINGAMMKSGGEFAGHVKFIGDTSMASGASSSNGGLTCESTGAGQSAGMSFYNRSSSNGIRVRFDPTGTFGWGGWSKNGYTFQQTSDGNVAITGNLNELSDPRLKTDIELIEDPLSIIRKFKAYRFIWGDALLLGDRAGKQDVGGLSTEIKEAVPEMVSSFTNGDESYDNVNYGKAVPLIASAVSQVDDKVVTLTNRNKELETELSNLTSRFLELTASIELMKSTIKELQSPALAYTPDPDTVVVPNNEPDDIVPVSVDLPDSEDAIVGEDPHTESKPKPTEE